MPLAPPQMPAPEGVPFMASNRGNGSASVWLVTGSTSGFGRAVSETVLQDGGCVVATGREQAPLEALTSKHPDRALALRLDVTDAAAAKGVINRAVDHFGRVDVLFNNAGYGH